MKHLLITISILTTLLLGSCQSKATKTSAAKDSSTAQEEELPKDVIVQKTYHPTGGLWKVNRARKVVEDGKSKYVLDGEVLEYYKTPKNALSSRSIYKEGKRDGMFIKYYTDGKVYYEINYTDGKMNGIKKSYFKTGKLMAEMPYKNGSLGVGTKEYTPDGKLVPPMELKVWYTKSGSSAIVYAKTMNKGKLTKRAEYFEGALIDEKYTFKGQQTVNMHDGIAQMTLYNNPTKVTISAKVRSARNNYFLLSKTISIK